MIVINKLAKPGDIRRVDLYPDSVCVHLVGGVERLYKLVGMVQNERKQLDDVRPDPHSQETAQRLDTP